MNYYTCIANTWQCSQLVTARAFNKWCFVLMKMYLPPPSLSLSILPSPSSCTLAAVWGSVYGDWGLSSRWREDHFSVRRQDIVCGRHICARDESRWLPGTIGGGQDEALSYKTMHKLYTCIGYCQQKVPYRAALTSRSKHSCSIILATSKKHLVLRYKLTESWVAHSHFTLYRRRRALAVPPPSGFYHAWSDLHLPPCPCLAWAPVWSWPRRNWCGASQRSRCWTPSLWKSLTCWAWRLVGECFGVYTLNTKKL